MNEDDKEPTILKTKVVKAIKDMRRKKQEELQNMMNRLVDNGRNYGIPLGPKYSSQDPVFKYP